MITTYPLSEVLLGRTPREKLQQGWSPRCLTTPAGEEKWGVLKTTAIQAGEFRDHENKELPSTLQERLGLEVRVGDLLMTCAGPRGRCGVATLVRRTRPQLMLSGKMYRFRPDPEKADPRFLESFLLSPDAQRRIDSMKTGISDSGLNLTKDRFLGLPVPLPSIAEQRRIVDILEDHLSRLDAASEYLRSADARLAGLEAVSLDQLANADDASSRLGDLAVSAGYGTSTKCIRGALGVAVVRIPNLRRGEIDLSDEKRVVTPDVDLSKLMLSRGDLLVVRTNGSRDLIGRTALVQAGIKASFASYLIRYKLDEARVRPSWVHLMLRRPEARRTLEAMAASSAGQYNLSLAKLHEIEIPVPSLQSQDQRLKEFTDRASDGSGIHTVIGAAAARTARLRHSLLSAAFSGRLIGHTLDLDRAEELAT